MAERIRRAHRENQDHHERPPDLDRDPHHALNRPVGEPDETADSDPYGE